MTIEHADQCGKNENELEVTDLEKAEAHLQEAAAELKAAEAAEEKAEHEIEEAQQELKDAATHDHDKVTSIIVNGRQREVHGKKISYIEVVQLAFPGAQLDGNTAYTVAYANPHGKDGTLVNGQDVHVQEGMVFNVTKTNRS